MAQAATYEVMLRRTRKRNFPKKILLHRKINLTEKYAFTVSVWVADTPESRMRPTINLVFRHSNQRMCLSFDDVQHMLEAATEVRNFVLDGSFKIHDAQNEALRQFVEHHERQRLRALNDYTVNTVIQDITPRKYDGKRVFLNTRTGEVIDRV